MIFFFCCVDIFVKAKNNKKKIICIILDVKLPESKREPLELETHHFEAVFSIYYNVSNSSV